MAFLDKFKRPQSLSDKIIENNRKNNNNSGGFFNNSPSRSYTTYGAQTPSRPAFGNPPRTIGGKTYEEIRDQRGLKMGDIITFSDGSRIEARDASGILLGWYMPMYNLTYDARTCCSIAQGNILTGLIYDRGTKYP